MVYFCVECGIRDRLHELSGSQALVLLCIASHMNDNRQSWPSYSTICEETGLSRTPVSEALKRLISGGWLKVVHGSGGKSNRYKIASKYVHMNGNGGSSSVQKVDSGSLESRLSSVQNLDSGSLESRLEEDTIEEDTTEEDTKKKNTRSRELVFSADFAYQAKSVAPVQQTRPQKQATVAKPVAPVQQNVAKPVASVQRSSTKRATCKKEEGKEENISHSREFEMFYAAYPKQIRRGEAVKAWNGRIKEGILPALLVRAATNYANHCASAGTEYRYIMYPASFLGPERRGYEEWQEPRTAPKNGGKREGSREAEFDEAARLLGIKVTG